MSAIRDTIFNNYLEAYSPSITRYDSHKKSELRSTYNSIVKLNKESPWFLPTTSKEAQGYAVRLKESARELRSDIAEAGGLDEDSILNKKSAYSTDSSVASAIYIGSDESTDSVPSFEIEVKNLASPQENSGYFLPDGPVALEEDTYSFDVSINDMNYEFQFSISSGETNKAVQERLARLINNSGIGLKANVAASNGGSSLQIQSESSGLIGDKEQIFSITDDRTSKTAGAVDYFGLDLVSRRAANANFTINGEDRSASSNHFTVGKLYEVTLNGTSGAEGPATIGLKTDTESIADNVTKLVGSYNKFLEQLGKLMTPVSKNKQLVSEMTRIADYYSSSLNEIGIRIDENGSMQVDEDELKYLTGQSDDLQETLKPVKDFSNALLRKSNQIALNPMDYVQRTVVAYKNPGKNFASPYTTSAYSGMMYNFFC